MMVDVGLMERPGVMVQVGPRVAVEPLGSVRDGGPVKQVEKFPPKRVRGGIVMRVVMVDCDVDQAKPQKGVRGAHQNFDPHRGNHDHDGSEDPQKGKDNPEVADEFAVVFFKKVRILGLKPGQ